MFTQSSWNAQPHFETPALACSSPLPTPHTADAPRPVYSLPVPLIRYRANQLLRDGCVFHPRHLPAPALWPAQVSVVAEEDCIVCRMPVEAVPQDWLERLNENCAALRELTPFHREALRTPVLRRSPKHVALVQQLVGAYAFFQQFEPDVLYKLCARLMLEELEAPHVKLTQGQAGSEFSVIMEGRVAIFVDDDSTRMTKGGKKVSSERRRADRQAYTQVSARDRSECHVNE